MGVNGHPPLLEGAACDAVIRIEPQGKLTDPCHRIYLCFDGVWRRLYFDFGMIFWREQPSPPKAEASQSEFSWHDLGRDEGLAGLKLVKYEMFDSGHSSEVIFYFTGGRRLRFVANSSLDIATYELL